MIGSEISESPSSGELSVVGKSGTFGALLDFAKPMGENMMVKLMPANVDEPSIEVSYFVLQCRVPKMASTTSTREIQRNESAETLERFVFWCHFGIVRAMSADAIIQLYSMAEHFELTKLCEDIISAVGDLREMHVIAAVVTQPNIMPKLWAAFADAYWKSIDISESTVMPSVMNAATSHRLMRHRFNM